MSDTLARLFATIAARRTGDPATSYVAKLTAKGRAKIAQKLGEEAVETVIAAMQDDPAALTSEAADLMFHLLILLADAGLTPDDVLGELSRRENVSGLVEKARRLPSPSEGSGVGKSPRASVFVLPHPPAPSPEGEGEKE